MVCCGFHEPEMVCGPTEPLWADALRWPSDSLAGTWFSCSSFSANESISKFSSGHEASGWGGEEAQTKKISNMVYWGALSLGQKASTPAQFSGAIVFPPLLFSWWRICLQCTRPQFNSWIGKIPWRKDRLPTLVFLGFSDGSDGKESACNAGDLGSTPGWERPPREGNGYTLQ